MRSVLLGLLLVATPGVGWAGELSVSDAFSRATPGAGPGVAYFTIHGGDVGDRLVGVTSPRSAKVELHTMSMDGDVMRMREVDAIEVPAGAEVKLAPGGLHLMLTGLAAPLKTGESVALTLRFEHAGDRTIEVPVGALGAAGPMAPMPTAGMPGPAPEHDKMEPGSMEGHAR